MPYTQTYDFKVKIRGAQRSDIHDLKERIVALLHNVNGSNAIVVETDCKFMPESPVEKI